MGEAMYTWEQVSGAYFKGYNRGKEHAAPELAEGEKPTANKQSTCASQIADSITMLLFRYGSHMPIDAFRDLQDIGRQVRTL